MAIRIHIGGALLAATLLAAGAAQAQGPRYVAMGSSYAAGPGITRPADDPPDRCGRSADNYAHQLARRRGLDLADVSCGGAVTASILAPWNGHPAQIDAVTPATSLVTVTIGGNDVGLIAGLGAG
ncbi:MAG TPA: GDSL-type esterase/lipase family protein, partial [Polyangia bacterium]|nr:GDSL-type esterase/lipase family protein [Polyangia bacterium]